MNSLPQNPESFFIFRDVPEEVENSDVIKRRRSYPVMYDRLPAIPEDTAVYGWARGWWMKHRSMSRGTKHGAGMVRKNVAFDENIVTVEYLVQLWKEQDGICALSGRRMALAMPLRINAKQDELVSVDRIDSKKGYQSGNIQLVCLAVNYMKTDTTQADFIRWCEDVARKKKAPPADCIAELKRLGIYDATR